MTLQTNGAISISQINTEKGLSASASNSSLTTLSTSNINTASSSRPNQSTPHAMSEFYGYNHNAASGECYYVYNYNPNTSGLISWTDINGTGRSGYLAGYSGAYVCSTTLPTENPAADVDVSSCSNPCSIVYTSFSSQGCAC